MGSAHHRSLRGSLCCPCLPAESFSHCSFEQGLCSWEVEVEQPAWERNTSLNLGTGYGIPTRDHSSNSRAGTWPNTSQGAPVLVPRLCPPAPGGNTGLGLACGCAEKTATCICTPNLAPLSPFLASPAGFFLHVGSALATGTGSTARLSSPTLKANKSCSVSHSQDPMSQPLWAWR